MKKLREGFTTGSCAAAAALASVLWQTKGVCPEGVEIETPAGILFHPEIEPLEYGVCGVRKDGGDDPDQTNGCMVYVHAEIQQYEGDVTFCAGEGIGTVTKKGMKLPVGEAAVNPVPRQMIEKAVRSVIGKLAVKITISIPEGEKIAERTLNGRLGISGGLSVLGTTGIVRPMSEEAVKESLRLELSVCRAEYGTACALVTGYSGEEFLKKQFPDCGPVCLCSNYLGYMLDCAEEMGFSHILLAGGTGKLIKPAADIMYLHSHTAGGQREIICTHAALCGAEYSVIKKLYDSVTTVRANEILQESGTADAVWKSIAESAAENCMKRVHGKIKVGIILTDEKKQMLAQSEQCGEILRKWRKNDA